MQIPTVETVTGLAQCTKEAGRRPAFAKKLAGERRQEGCLDEEATAEPENQRQRVETCSLRYLRDPDVDTPQRHPSEATPRACDIGRGGRRRKTWLGQLCSIESRRGMGGHHP